MKFIVKITLILLIFDVKASLGQKIKSDSIKITGKIKSVDRSMANLQLKTAYSLEDWVLWSRKQVETNIDDNGYFNLKLPNVNKPYRISILVSDTSDKAHAASIYSYDFFVEPKDDIIADISLDEAYKTNEFRNPDSSSFSGTGSEKYNLAWTFQNHFQESYMKEISLMKFDRPIKDSLELNSRMNEYVALMRKFKYIKSQLINKSKLSREMREIMEFDFGHYNGGFNYDWLMRCGALYNGNLKYQDQIAKNYLRYSMEFYDIPTDAAKYCPYYIRELMNRIYFEVKIQEKIQKADLKNVYNIAKLRYSGDVRDQLIGLILTHPSTPLRCMPYSIKIQDSLIQDILKLNTSSFVKKALEEKQSNLRSMNLKIMDAQFTEINGEKFNLESLKGKVIVIDTWFNGCFGCTGFYEYFEKVYPKFKDNKNFVVLSINVDKNRDRWINGIESNLYTSKNYIQVTTGNWFDDPFMKQYNITYAPYLMVIDTNGSIAANTNVNNIEAQIKKALDRIESR